MLEERLSEGNEKSADAEHVTSQSVQPAATLQSGDSPARYLLCLLLLAVCGLGGIWYGNQSFAPEMYHHSGPVAFAEAFMKGKNYAVFDLNINIRDMRNEHIKRLDHTPEVVVLGASHWQEGHTELMPGKDFYNAHVHRDYYEDMLAVTEMFVRHDKLPPKMIIAIRDRLFTPIAARKDHLWLPGIPYYRDMARRLGIEPHPYWATAPVQRWRELLSLSMLYSNVHRWYTAPLKPHATMTDHFDALDTLRPGGSIYWSGRHKKIFTPERSRRLAEQFAEENFRSAPKIDPVGVRTIDRLLAFLKEKEVDVYLVHPPFNPVYFDRIRNSPYREGLARIESLTRDFAAKYGFKVFGSFDPAEVGCTADMYIDAEHSNPDCLKKVFAQYLAIDRMEPKSGPGYKIALFSEANRAKTDGASRSIGTELIETGEPALLKSAIRTVKTFRGSAALRDDKSRALEALIGQIRALNVAAARLVAASASPQPEGNSLVLREDFAANEMPSSRQTQIQMETEMPNRPLVPPLPVRQADAIHMAACEPDLGALSKRDASLAACGGDETCLSHIAALSFLPSHEISGQTPVCRRN
jgi:hypothetical protein